MRILILTTSYPTKDNIYSNIFVHTRVKEYLKQSDIEIKVVGWNVHQKAESYNYEGVNVFIAESQGKLTEYIFHYKPDKLLIHIIEIWTIKLILKQLKIPVIIWVHGYEAIGWYRRLFNFSSKNWKELYQYIKFNTVQQYYFRKLITYSNRNKTVHFVFVSKWMKKVTEFDTLSKVKNHSIIPNPIDTELFIMIPANPEKKNKILLIRPFTSNKYANDIAINAILILSKKHFFNNLEFAIYGEGEYFKILTSKIKNFKNVKLFNNFIENKDIPGIHKNYGIFLCPTRQDAQGVSMCEAMSSGLIPITTNNTAIPEFVTNNVSGFLTHNAKEIALKIEEIYNSNTLYSTMSLSAHKHVNEKCSKKNVIKQELELILGDCL